MKETHDLLRQLPKLHPNEEVCHDCFPLYRLRSFFVELLVVDIKREFRVAVLRVDEGKTAANCGL
jgi:hypothetical protein